MKDLNEVFYNFWREEPAHAELNYKTHEVFLIPLAMVFFLEEITHVLLKKAKIPNPWF